ncbi:unnamed protein product [Protopolystoma xenopodis]|uniref:Uncharacterized protein n=1 Tax=Protopolystoma xenopodis TaxID=117903 RepID=A0A3S4ZN76_9PLAT|nr:unnamed protein product [Protopolystoma xenopodis]
MGGVRTCEISSHSLRRQLLYSSRAVARFTRSPRPVGTLPVVGLKPINHAESEPYVSGSITWSFSDPIPIQTETVT